MFESTTDIIIGDFNAHVGSLPCGSTALDNTALLPTTPGYLHLRHTACQSLVNVRGSSLSRFIEDNQLLMLNGRCSGDTFGSPTFEYSLPHG